MLSEKDLRKPGFDEGSSAPVVLGDGQVWYLPKPFVDFWPTVVDGKITTQNGTSFGPEFDAKVKAVSDGNGSSFLADVFSLGIDMLGRNYDLADADYAAILRYRASNEASQEWLNAIITVASGGDAPKLSAATYD